jgi:hypothetical protein
VRTASTGARVEIDATGGTPGLFVRNGNAASNIRGFLSSDGSGFLGSTDGTAGNAAMSWSAAGAAIINASAITTGTLNAGAISVTNLSASSITTGTLSASRISGGTFDASSMTVTNLSASSITTGTLSASRISGGTLDASTMTVSNLSASSITTGTLNGASVTVTNLSASSITSGTLNVGSLTVSGTFTAANISGGTLAGGFNIGTSTLTLNSTGKIIDADGSYWDQSGMVFIATGSLGDSLHWRYSSWSSNRPQSFLQTIGSTTVSGLAITSQYGNGSSTSMGSSITTNASSSQGTTTLSAGPEALGPFTQISVLGHGTNTSSRIRAIVHDRAILDMEYTNRRALFYGYIYPGPDSGSTQTSRYISDNGTALFFQTPYPRYSGTSSHGGSAQPLFHFDAAFSDGSTNNWSTHGPGTANITSGSTSYVLINLRGTLYRIPIWANS